MKIIRTLSLVLIISLVSALPAFALAKPTTEQTQAVAQAIKTYGKLDSRKRLTLPAESGFEVIQTDDSRRKDKNFMADAFTHNYRGKTYYIKSLNNTVDAPTVNIDPVKHAVIAVSYNPSTGTSYEIDSNGLNVEIYTKADNFSQSGISISGIGTIEFLVVSASKGGKYPFSIKVGRLFDPNDKPKVEQGEFEFDINKKYIKYTNTGSTCPSVRILTPTEIKTLTNLEKVE